MSTPASARTTQRRSLRAAAMGNILEWFDWTLYAVFSTYIAAHFFDNSNPTSALLATLAVFAVGFLARPVGALVFGRIADVRGRKFVLVATITTMSAASLLIAVIPGFDTIGIWASVLLVIARLLQGFAHGGESGVSYTYVSEIAPPARRGLWSSSVFIAVTVGVMLATLLGAGFNTVLGPEAVADVGWRYAFVFGAVFGLLVLFLRRSAMETEEFESVTDEESDRSATELQGWSRGRRFSAGVLVILLACGHNCAYYVWAIFASSLAIADRGMDPTAAFTASLLAQAVALLALAGWGKLSDRIGRRPLMIGFGIAAIVSFYPLSALISDEPWTLFVAQAVGMSVWAMGAGMYPALISELFPTPIRATSVAIATSISVALFGGTAPYLLTWTGEIGMPWLFWIWTSVLAALAIVGALIMKETRGSDLNAVGSPFRRDAKVPSEEDGELVRA
ncbi:MFS transporter [Agromyces archimandritae]|uniref:MFS transporter n=1 Tax=Agromyces archimandritae TaxID=2781962 RepID=A0A975FNH6_9MICO|nr:MFS transporter [Agromyces archimandritae]QTX05379.1 MFS transporter [Agromyces archimandritae]